MQKIVDEFGDLYSEIPEETIEILDYRESNKI